MKVGLQLYHWDWPGSPQNIGEKLVEIAKTAESAGFSSIWIMDHFFQLGKGFGPPEITQVEGPILEGYTTMSYVAAVTQKIKVGLLVTGNIYRHPGILVKTVTTLDVLSGGRAYLGIGAGWYEREAKGLGVPFPSSVGERFKCLEETLQIAHHMWREDYSPFKGKYYQLDEPINSPQPLSKPHPPILIGGDGEKTLLRLIASYADALNFHVGGPVEGFPPYIRVWYQNRKERLTRKLGKLKVFCNKVGRSYDDIERTVLATIKLAPTAMDASEVVELCQELAEIGIQHIIFNMPNTHEITPLEIFGKDIIPQVTEF
ncbi:MAG: LLM class F420-dependent oxidoreductase [Theionarchaea archaeon]|nr:LLM class F420-dependent oxidoreductase [Theionarchaea archaeon]